MTDSVRKFIIQLFLDSDTSGGKEVEASLEAIGKKAKAAGEIGQKMSLYFTAPLTAFAALSARTFADFEATMSRVGAVSGATEEQLKALSLQARALGASTRFSASDAAEAMTYLAQSGFSVQEMQAAMPNVLNLAASAMLDMGSSANIVSNILRGFGISVDELGHANDVLVKAFTNSNTDLRMLGESMKYVAPVAKATGQSIEDITASVGALGNAGIQGSAAGVAIRSAIGSLVSPSKEAQKLLSSLGIKVLDAAGKMRPFLDIISELSDAGISSPQIFEIFGNRSASAIAAMTELGGEKLREFSSTLKDSEGTTSRIAKQQEDNLKGAFFQIQSAVEEAQLSISKSSLGAALREIVMQGYDLINSFNSASDSTKKWVTSIGLAVAAIGPTLFAASKFVAVMSTMSKITTSAIIGVRALSGAFTSATTSAVAATLAVRAFRAAISTIGIGVLVTALSYLASGLLDSLTASGDLRAELAKSEDAMKLLGRASEDGGASIRQMIQDMNDAAKQNALLFSINDKIAASERAVAAYGAQISELKNKQLESAKAAGIGAGAAVLGNLSRIKSLEKLIEKENEGISVLKKSRAEAEATFRAKNEAQEAKNKAEQNKRDEAAFVISKKRLELTEKQAAKVALSDKERAAATAADIAELNREIAAERKLAANTNASFADRSLALDTISTKINERIALESELKTLTKKADEERRDALDAEKKAFNSAMPEKELNILRAQVSGNKELARQLAEELSIEKDALEIRQNSNLDAQAALDIARERVALNRAADAEKVRNELQSQLIEAQITALKQRGKDVDAEALRLQKDATDAAEKYKISYGDALNFIKQINDLQKTRSTVSDVKNVIYGKSVAQIEKEQADIKRLLNSANWAQVQRGTRRAQKFEDKYGIGVDDDARDYKGRDRRTGKLVNPDAGVEELQVQDQAYMRARGAGPSRALPEAQASLGIPTPRPAAPQTNKYTRTEGETSQYGSALLPRRAPSYSERQRTEGETSANGPAALPRRAPSYSERQAAAKNPPTTQSAEPQKAAKTEDNKAPDISSTVAEGVQALASMSDQIKTLVDAIKQTDNNVKGSVNRLSRRS